MNPQDQVRQLIGDYYNAKASENPKFSLRMMASDLGIAPAALSSFMNGKRNFSKKMAIKVLGNISLPPEDLVQVETLFNKNKDQSVEALNKVQLQSKLYHLLVDPVYYSYLSLLETDNFDQKDSTAAKRLGVSEAKIRKVKEELISLKLIGKVENKLIPTDAILGSTDNIPSHSLRARHIRNMEDSKKAITNEDLDRRYFAFETLSFAKEDLPLVQKKINQLMDDLMWLSKKGTKKDEVYEFCSHYFPRTKK